MPRQPTIDPQDPLTRRVRQACRAAGSFIEYWGYKEIQGRIWLLLAVSTRPLSQSAIAQTLEVSRSLVSGTIRELIDFGLVKPTSDHRNAPYEAVLDVWPTISDILRDREWMLVESTRLALESAMEEAEFTDSDDLPYDIDRMRMLLTMTELAQSLLKMLIGARVPRTAGELGDWFGKAQTFLRAISVITG